MNNNKKKKKKKKKKLLSPFVHAHWPPKEADVTVLKCV
jgi:hypothetical protein